MSGAGGPATEVASGDQESPKDARWPMTAHLGRRNSEQMSSVRGRPADRTFPGKMLELTADRGRSTGVVPLCGPRVPVGILSLDRWPWGRRLDPLQLLPTARMS